MIDNPDYKGEWKPAQIANNIFLMLDKDGSGRISYRELEKTVPQYADDAEVKKSASPGLDPRRLSQVASFPATSSASTAQREARVVKTSVS